MVHIRSCRIRAFCCGQNPPWMQRDRDTPARLPRMSVVERTIVGMRTLEICERCDGTGADPTQHSEEITLCVECSGDGCHVTYYVELAQTA
ncbi:hypothetical protein [Leifsonia sp. 2MCAF36]|uniref:hypothetical protein n=1 Tax=Leifsonia sp. 2MCAF36 TaxID=3232988 RepID=UPI003F99BEC0